MYRVVARGHELLPWNMGCKLDAQKLAA